MRIFLTFYLSGGPAETQGKEKTAGEDQTMAANVTEKESTMAGETEMMTLEAVIETEVLVAEAAEAMKTQVVLEVGVNQNSTEIIVHQKAQVEAEVVVEPTSVNHAIIIHAAKQCVAISESL